MGENETNLVPWIYNSLQGILKDEEQVFILGGERYFTLKKIDGELVLKINNRELKTLSDQEQLLRGSLRTRGVLGVVLIDLNSELVEKLGLYEAAIGKRLNIGSMDYQAVVYSMR